MTGAFPRPFCVALALLAVLPGCAKFETDTMFEPYSRQGTWTVEGVNQSNLAAQLVDPLDMVRGRGDSSPHYKQPTQAVTTLWSARPTQSLLPGLKGGGEVQPGMTAAPVAPVVAPQ